MHRREMRSTICHLSILGLMLALLLLPKFSLAQEKTTLVRLEPASAETEVGSAVSVSIVVEEVRNLRGVEAHLVFDPQVVRVVDDDPDEEGVQIRLGPFLKTDSVFKNEVNQDAGHISFAYSQKSTSAPATGNGVLATITFRGLSADVSALTFSRVNLAGADGIPIDHTTRDGQVAVLERETRTATPSTPAVTPTVTIAPTPTATPTPKCEEVLGEHVVRPGETLYAIGRAYGVRPYTIALRNDIVNPSLIHPSTTLAIPDTPWFPIPAGPVARRQFGRESFPPCRAEHTVRRGENLFRISLRYKVSMWAVAEANGIYNLHYIRAGQMLCIP